MSQAEDQMLIQRIQQGDRASLNALIRKYELRAYQYAFRLTRNQDDASDIVADAFVRVNSALPNFKGNSAFTTWLYRIITNVFLDHRKRERNKVNLSLDTSGTNEDGDIERQIEDDAASPHEEAEKSERERAFESAVGKLSEYQRAMIVMFHAEMLSYEEIAEALDLPLGTVKSRLNRARINLRDELGHYKELF